MSSTGIEVSLKGLNIGTFTANEAIIRVVQAVKAIEGSTYQDLASEYGIPPSRAHSLFSEGDDSEPTSRKINADLVERIAQHCGLSIDEVLRLGRVVDRKNIENILKARRVAKFSRTRSAVADAQDVLGGLDIKRIETSQWNCYQDEESAFLSGLNDLLRVSLPSYDGSRNYLRWNELVSIASQNSIQSPLLAAAQMSAVGRQRSKLRAWRTFEKGREYVDHHLRDVDRVLVGQGPERAFAMLTSNYLGLRGIGETTASYYLFFRGLSSELPPSSRPAYPMTPASIEALRRYGRPIDRTNRLPESKYHAYLNAVNDLSQETGQPPIDLSYSLTTK